MQESPCQCRTNFRTDVPVAVDSSVGKSVNFKIWRLQNLCKISLRSKTRAVDYPAVLVIPSLQDISADWG